MIIFLDYVDAETYLKYLVDIFLPLPIVTICDDL